MRISLILLVCWICQTNSMHKRYDWNQVYGFRRDIEDHQIPMITQGASEFYAGKKFKVLKDFLAAPSDFGDESIIFLDFIKGNNLEVLVWDSISDVNYIIITGTKIDENDKSKKDVVFLFPKEWKKEEYFEEIVSVIPQKFSWKTENVTANTREEPPSENYKDRTFIVLKNGTFTNAGVSQGNVNLQKNDELKILRWSIEAELDPLSPEKVQIFGLHTSWNGKKNGGISFYFPDKNMFGNYFRDMESNRLMNTTGNGNTKTNESGYEECRKRKISETEQKANPMGCEEGPRRKIHKSQIIYTSNDTKSGYSEDTRRIMPAKALRYGDLVQPLVHTKLARNCDDVTNLILKDLDKFEKEKYIEFDTHDVFQIKNVTKGRKNCMEIEIDILLSSHEDYTRFRKGDKMPDSQRKFCLSEEDYNLWHVKLFKSIVQKNYD